MSASQEIKPQRTDYRARCKLCAKAYNAGRYIKNKEHITATNKAWREANPERVIATRKAWNAANKEPKTIMNKTWREANKERIAVTNRAWYQANKQHRAAYIKAYDKANRDKAIAKTHAYRARKACNGIIEKILKSEIWERDKGVCGVCGGQATESNWHLDHVLPLSKGGTHTYDNVQVSHPHCNQSKGAKIPTQHHEVLSLPV